MIEVFKFEDETEELQLVKNRHASCAVDGGFAAQGCEK